MAKKEKKEKSKVSSLLLLLLLSVVMLATTTYAWFTANTKVSISDINIQVQASGGLQISTDAVTWKTIIANEDITTNAYTGNTNQLPAVLEPVSSGLTLNSGRINMYYGTVAADATGEFKLTTVGDVEAKGTTGHFVAFDVFLKSTAATDIYLDSGSGVTNTVTEGVTSADKGLQNSARIAFIKEGTVSVDNYANALTQQTTSQSDVYLWEPNVEQHHSYGIANNGTYVRTTISETNAPLTTYGVNSDVSTGVLLSDAYKGTGGMASPITVALTETTGITSVNSTAFTGGLVSNGTTNAFGTATEGVQKKLFANMGAGITKVRIYMWIEGQDIDCNNEASGSNLTFRVNLSIPNV